MTNTAPRPMRVVGVKIVHESSCNRISWIGRQAKVYMADDSVVFCEHDHGHRTNKAFVACATRLVAKLNRAAGTTSAAVEAELAAKKANAA